LIRLVEYLALGPYSLVQRLTHDLLRVLEHASVLKIRNHPEPERCYAWSPASLLTTETLVSEFKKKLKDS